MKLIDFGVAKAATNAQKTKEGLIKGKVSYMSPEQARGERIDRRSDLYSLGVDLIEMLTYEQAVRGRAMLERLANVQAGLLIDYPSHLRNAPRTLLGVLRKATAFDKEQRYRTAAQMEQALAGVLGTIDASYTPQNLARLVEKLDDDRAARSRRMRDYATISLTEVGVEAEEPRASVATDDAKGVGLRFALTIGALLGIALAAMALWLR